MADARFSCEVGDNARNSPPASWWIRAHRVRSNYGLKLFKMLNRSYLRVMAFGPPLCAGATFFPRRPVPKSAKDACYRDAMSQQDGVRREERPGAVKAASREQVPAWRRPAGTSRASGREWSRRGLRLACSISACAFKGLAISGGTTCLFVGTSMSGSLTSSATCLAMFSG